MMTKQKTLPHFPFYPADFISKTGRLTDEQVGAYIRLLCEQWIAGDIPLVDAHGDASALRMLSESIDKSWPSISKYFERVGNGMKNPRMEEVRLKAIDIYTKRVDAAKTRWADDNASADADDNASASATQNPKPITNNTEQKTQKERKRFAPPSMDEVIKLFIEKGSSKIEAEKFFYFYESKNWMVGKVKMKSWTASVSGWIARNKSKEIEDRGYVSTLE